MDNDKKAMKGIMAGEVEKWNGKTPIGVIQVISKPSVGEHTVKFNGIMKPMHMKAVAICLISMMSVEEQADTLLEAMKWCCSRHPEIQDMIDKLIAEQNEE